MTKIYLRIPPELRASIYGAAISFGNLEDFYFLEQNYFNENYETERARIIYGLAKTKNISLVK